VGVRGTRKLLNKLLRFSLSTRKESGPEKSAGVWVSQNQRYRGS